MTTSSTAKVARNLERFRIAVNSHDRLNPTHNAYGIGLSHFDLQRLDFDEGETLWPGITVHADGGQSAMFRVLCDGTHDGAEREATITRAVGEEVRV